MTATALAMLAATILAPGEAPTDPAAPKDAFQYEIQDGGIQITTPRGRTHSVSIPCKAESLAVQNQRLYVACGNEGLAVFSLESPSTPQLLGVRLLGGRVLGFHGSNEGLWVEVAHTQAVLLDSLQPTVPRKKRAELSASKVSKKSKREAKTPKGPASKDDKRDPPPAQQKAEHVATRVGKVSDATAGQVVVTLGRKAGLATGDHVLLFEEAEVELAPGETTIRERTLAVGKVTAISGKHAQVGLGLNETVPIGAKAKHTLLPLTASALLPPRPAATWEVGFTLRPFLALGAFGLGTVSDAYVSMRLDSGVHLEALVEPLGIGYADVGNVVASAANLLVAYDTRYFEVGLGAGWSAVNNDIESSAETRASGDIGFEAIQPRFKNVRSGLSLAQVARLGAQDGLRLTVRNTFLSYKKAFHYGGTVAEVMAPIGRKSWLFGQGGGGASGFGYGELGLRLMLWGDGGPDSFFLSASLGGAGLFGEKRRACSDLFDPPPAPPSDDEPEPICFEDISYAGPMVGIGFEWRP